MNRKKIGILALLLLFAATFLVGVNSVDSANGACNYLLVGPSNTSDGEATQNQTFKAVIQSPSNQTSSQTFIRLENQNGYVLVHNTTGNSGTGVVNGSGETSTFTATWAATLDAQQTYKVSAAFFYLNNTFYNYTATQFNCGNRTFQVDAVSGWIPATSGFQEAAVQQQNKNSTMLWIVVLAIIIIVAVSLMKNKR